MYNSYSFLEELFVIDAAKRGVVKARNLFNTKKINYARGMKAFGPTYSSAEAAVGHKIGAGGTGMYSDLARKLDGMYKETGGQAENAYKKGMKLIAQDSASKQQYEKSLQQFKKNAAATGKAVGQAGLGVGKAALAGTALVGGVGTLAAADAIIN